MARLSELVEYEEGTSFPGRIGRTVDQSSAAWPAPKRARPGSPNVIVFVLDDVGFGQLSPFGGLVDTPTLDRLAARGLRYTNFQTTALCSPTRGCVLTGRNHHSLGLSAITELSMGYPAHNGMMGFEHGFLSEMLLEQGYNTFAVGKWHLTPPEEGTLAGPFTRWPLGRGFERYYGFLGGDTDQWHPDLTYDNHPVEQPYQPEDGYHLNVDLADNAIRFIKDANNVAPDKPFFLYYATGAGHAPHHVEPEWIEPYRGRFDGGWEAYRETALARQKEMGIVPADTELSRHDPDVPAWDSLSDDQRRLFARQMETYAGFITQTDHHFGRIIDYLELIGELDDTMVIVLSDNGASAEGGLEGTFNETLFFNNAPETLEDNLAHYEDWGGVDTFPHYSWGWTWAGVTPFRRWKREVYRGGISDPLIVSWPSGISDHGGVRDQYCHAIDLVPTVLDALGVAPPDQIRGVGQSDIQGASFSSSFDDPAAAPPRDTQYFEMFGQRSIYHDGWKAVCAFPGPSFTEAAEKGRFFGGPLTAETLEDLDATGWELYHVAVDPAENHDLATEDPERLRSMIDLWYQQADAYGVLPLATADMARLNAERPTLSGPRERYVYQSDAEAIPFAASPRVYNRPHSITADVEIPEGGADGVLIAHGNRHGGYTLFVKDGRLHHVHNYCGKEVFRVTTPEPVPSGRVALRYEFEPTGEPDLTQGRGTPGRSQLYIDGDLVASTDVPYTVPNLFSIIGLTCGRDGIDAVSPDDYASPNPFAGTIHAVTLDVSGDLIADSEADLARLMAQQ
jgi:arylsulfatase A-like enzyme